MNTKKTKEYFETNKVVALKADKGKIPEEVKEILIELGNPKEAIPYYAVYGPGIKEPITFDNIITRKQVIRAIEEAMGGKASVKVAAGESKSPH